MSEPRLQLSISNGIATVTLNRADKRNALDLPMFQAISTFFLVAIFEML